MTPYSIERTAAGWQLKHGDRLLNLWGDRVLVEAYAIWLNGQVEEPTIADWIEGQETQEPVVV